MMSEHTEIVLDNILQRVQNRITRLGINENIAEKKSGAKIGTIRNWRRGALPRIDTLQIIAPALETTPEWLAYGVGAEDLVSSSMATPSILIPKISWVSASNFMSVDAVYPTDDFPKVSMTGLPAGDWFAFDIPDGYDSMDRISPPGSVIFVNRSNKRLTANACYVITDGEGGATYKRFRQSPLRFEPVSTNPVHEPLFPDEGNIPGIFGRVHVSMLPL